MDDFPAHAGAVELLGGDTEDDNMFPESLPATWKDIIDSEEREEDRADLDEEEDDEGSKSRPRNSAPIAGMTI